MKSNAAMRWRIDELGARVAQALAADYEGPPNGRVRDVPDERTIRYYTTLGLIERPAEMRGRTAFYGRRHLMQLVAIKRLQAKGLSLAEVQRQLIGLTEPALSKLARLPAEEEVFAEPASTRPLLAKPAARRPESFWKSTPAPVPPAGSNEAASGNTEASSSLPLQGVRLCADVTLLVEATRLLDNEDVEAIRRAATPMIERLETRRLIRPREEGETR